VLGETRCAERETAHAVVELEAALTWRRETGLDHFFLKAKPTGERGAGETTLRWLSGTLLLIANRLARVANWKLNSHRNLFCRTL